MPVLEIEIDGEHNESLHFRPLQRQVRGRFDMMRVSEPMAKVAASEWPSIPSQRLGIDADGNGYVAEPLHEDQYAPVREKIAKKGLGKLPPKLETFTAIHLPSWLYWIQRAVESGLAKVTKGKVPDNLGGEPVKNFVTGKPEPSNTDKLTTAIEKQNELFAKLLDKLSEK